MKTDLFQSCGHCWVFQMCWHIECSTFTASYFRIWNSSAGISSPPLILFVVMLPKAHLTLHSKMSGSRWVITPSWISGSLKSFLYSFSVYYCHLLLILSASIRSVPFLSFIEPIVAWNIPLVSLIFLKRSLVFPILLFFSISLHCLLRKAFLSLLALLWSDGYILPFLLCLSLLFFSQLYVRPPQITILTFCISFSIWSMSCYPVFPKFLKSWNMATPSSQDHLLINYLFLYIYLNIVPSLFLICASVRNDTKAETPVLWPPHAKSWLIGKDSDAGGNWGQEEKGTTEDEMAGWHH